MRQCVKYDSRVNVIDILICIHVINLNECWLLQISRFCCWYAYLLLLKSYSKFPGTSYRDHDAFFWGSGGWSLMVCLFFINWGDWFVEMVREYNNFIQKVPRHEIINHLKLLKKIPLSFIHDILQTVYIRTIHPRANQLKHYEIECLQQGS